MNNPTTENSTRRVLIFQSGADSDPLTKLLESLGYQVMVFNDTARALEHIRMDPPATIIVQDTGPEDPRAGELIKEALKISWTINSIVISDYGPDSIHDRFEGLGILGSVETFDDVNGFMKLLS